MHRFPHCTIDSLFACTPGEILFPLAFFIVALAAVGVLICIPLTKN